MRHLLFLGILTLVVGCGGKQTAQVSGVVRYTDGSPIEGAAKVITFLPAIDSSAKIKKAASGTLRDDGTFVMMTRRRGDGVICGKYNVTFAVLSRPTDPNSSLIPKKYTGEEPSPFEPIIVDRDITDLEFLLEKK